MDSLSGAIWREDKLLLFSCRVPYPRSRGKLGVEQGIKPKLSMSEQAPYSADQASQIKPAQLHGHMNSTLYWLSQGGRMLEPGSWVSEWVSEFTVSCQMYEWAVCCGFLLQRALLLQSAGACQRPDGADWKKPQQTARAPRWSCADVCWGSVCTQLLRTPPSSPWGQVPNPANRWVLPHLFFICVMLCRNSTS